MNESLSIPSGDRPTGRIYGTRSPVLGCNGVIATSQPLASAAGLQIMQEGGNAIDAAVTAAAVLAVVEAPMTGVGGDLYALVWDGASKQLKALDSSGRAGARASAESLTSRGLSLMPPHGPLTVTVPGAVAGWGALLRSHGTVPLARALAPAIACARNGYPIAEVVARQWQAVADRLALDAGASAAFLQHGRAPRAGDVVRNADLASTLEEIASGGPEALYQGPLGAAIANHVARLGGFLTPADFVTHVSDWVDPIWTTYRGYTLFEMPPSTQGFVALEMLNILEGYDIRALGHNSAEYLHLLAEAKRIAFADRSAYLADARHVPPKLLATLISKAYADIRRGEIDLRRAAPGYAPYASQQPGAAGDTTYLAAADRFGNAISLINSLFDSFGSGIVTPGTGVALQSRGSGFSLEKGHPNELAPGKRPFHTLVPAFLMKDGKPFMAFGVMGGDNQAQAHAQIVANVVDFEMNVQEAGEVPRVRHYEDGLAIESGVPEVVREELRNRGHVVHEGRGLMGGYQAVRIDPDTGVLQGGSDPRKDGLAIGF